MNPLLAEIAAQQRDAALPATPEHARALALLEWDRVTAGVARHARARRAAEAVAATRPLIDADAIALRHRLADELRVEGDRDRWPPLCEVSDALDMLDRERPLRLDGKDLVHLAGVAAELDRWRDWFLDRRESCPRWSDAVAETPSFADLAVAVARALDRDGCVKDDATPRLARLRRQARDLERSVRGAVARAMDEARRRGWTNGPEVTVRGDRFCLPLHASARRRLEGIVHDRSATGGTVFVEPAAAVQLQNDLVECRLEGGAEIERILLELNAEVERAGPDLRDAAGLMLLCDGLRAGLVWSRAVDGRRPRLAPGAPLRVCRARHPLLLGQAADRPEVVPLDLELPADRRVLLISGPNAGGKSVALKCVGLLSLLAQSGWDVPAREDTTLPLLRRFSVDLGDEQSIERSLSSFSAHLGHLTRFLETATADTLVLCDEIGSGTDPEEGAALAFTVLEGLAERGCLVLASTHYGLLKAAAADHPAMVNAAMDFDELTLSPLFTLRVGAPGASHAFAMAERLSFPAELLARARDRLGEERFAIERLLEELATRARGMAEAEAERRRFEQAMAQDRRELGARLESLRRDRDEILAAQRREGEDLLAEGRRTLENVVRELRSGGATRDAISRGRERLAELGRRLRERAPAPQPAAREYRPGDRVRIPHLGLTGVVVEVRGGKLVADARGMRLNLGVDAVEPAQRDEAADGPREKAGWPWRGAAPAELQEIDLRGYRAEEAWDALDTLLDRAIPAGVAVVRVIHGHGTGRLREYLRERLGADDRVAGAADAAARQGGAGVTEVRLAD